MKILVFSIDTADRAPGKDEYNTIKSHLETGNIIVTNAMGVYKGQEESSFICLLTTELQEKMILATAHAYKQESVLEIDLPSKKSHLRYIDAISFVDKKPKEYVGIWQEVPVAEEPQDNFTLNLDNMKVYKCYPEVDKSASAC